VCEREGGREGEVWEILKSWSVAREQERNGWLKDPTGA